MIFPALLLLLILITTNYYMHPPPPLVRQPQVAAVIAPPVQSAAVQNVQSTVRRVKDIPPPKVEKLSAQSNIVEKSEQPERSAAVPKGFILKITVTQNGALMVTVDGSAAQPYELTAGDIIEWKAEKKVALELSNSARVDLELNGKPYKSLGVSGKPAYIEIAAEDIKQ
jgi:hypothetical protein